MKLSVLMLAYNHESYIQQAIESVMMQKTNFDFDLIIGEDYSKDKTRKIIRNLKKKYPKKIRLVLHSKNVGVTKNLIEVAKRCTGEYIAFLEGDDFWTDKNKLQKMVNFLDKNKAYIAACHDVNIINEKGEYIKEQGGYKKSLISPEDQVKYNNIYLLSLVFRNIWEKDYYLILTRLLKNINMIADYPLKLLLLNYGKIKYFPEKMGTYRLITNSGFSFSTLSKKNSLNTIYDRMYGFENLYNFKTAYSKFFKKWYLREKSIIIWRLLLIKQFKEINHFYKNNIIKDSLMDKIEIFIYLFIFPLENIAKCPKMLLRVHKTKRNAYE